MEGAAQRRKQRTKLEQGIAKLRRRATVATERYVDGLIDKAEYDRLIAKNRAEITALERELTALAGPAEPTLPPLDAVLKQVSSLANLFLEADVQSQRDALAAFIERVVPIREKRGQ